METLIKIIKFFSGRFLLLLPGILLLSVDAWGFSLGSITVKSQFNQNFSAEVPVALDGSMELKVFVGSDEDYGRLAVHRNSVVDEIRATVEIVDKKSALIKLSSSKPLIQPSFNLLLNCFHNGGTILENYVIAVDFQRSLSLSVPLEENRDQKLKETEKEKKNEEKQDEFAKQEFALLEKPIVVDKKRSPPPLTTDGKGMANRVKPAPQKVAPIKASSIKKGVVYRVRPKDTLYKIAKSIGSSYKNINQVVVAIWMKNVQKFKNQNMNLLEKGVVLDVNGIFNEAKSITKLEAVKIISAQWKSRKTPPAKIEIRIVTENMIPLPVEGWSNIEIKIAEAVSEWKESWESGDTDLLMEFYSRSFKKRYYDYSKWKKLKLKFNKKHLPFDVDVGNVNIRFKNKIVIASFIQRFESRLMKSQGTKQLYFVKERDEFKIVNEDWQKEIQKRERRPYVVHVGSFRSKKHAVRQVNLLRSKGYSAYETQYRTKKSVYNRVFIDRFSTKREAMVFAETLSKTKIVYYARPMYMPYSVETGSFSDNRDAVKEIARLRNIGYSPYPLLDCLEDGCFYKILIGAYKNKVTAIKIETELKRMGIKSSALDP